jgi:hypothetical protein
LAAHATLLSRKKTQQVLLSGLSVWTEAVENGLVALALCDMIEESSHA